MDRVRAFLTPARRKAIYATLAALGALVQTLGLADAVTVAHWLDVASQVLAVGGLLLAMLNTDTSTGTGMPEAASPLVARHFAANPAPRSGAVLHVRCPICGKTIDSVIEKETWGESIPGDTGCGNVTLHGSAMSEHVTQEHTTEEHLRAMVKFDDYHATRAADIRERHPEIFAAD